MAATYLDDIVAHHRERVARDRRDWSARREHVRYVGPSLRDALRPEGASTISVIAEVKRRSPSQGWIDQSLDPAGQAHAYEAGGARAISVLTEGPHFAGSLDDLDAVREVVALPLLRKDFSLGPNDVLDAADRGAAGVLLIVAALSQAELEQFAELARDCGVDALVEVHDEEECRRALDVGASIIGVNQRDLRSFEVDPARAIRVLEAIPPAVIAVAESGLRTSDDVDRVAGAGFDAVLVGESFVRAPDPRRAVKEFAAVPRVARA